MWVEVDAELTMAMVETIQGALETMEALEDDQNGDARRAALITAKRAAVGLGIVVGGWWLKLEEEADQLDPIATDDPETCEHPPPYFELPGQTMCKHCGASRVEDNEWKLL